MPVPLNIGCNARQGFDFKPSVKATFGFLTSLSFGSEKIPADMLGADPLLAAHATAPIKAGAPVQRGHTFQKKIVGVMSNLSWGGDHCDTLDLTFLVSIDNWGTLDLLFRTEKIDSQPKVTFCVAIYKWDYVQGCYFMRFRTTGDGFSVTSTDAEPCHGYLYARDGNDQENLEDRLGETNGQSTSRGLTETGDPRSAKIDNPDNKSLSVSVGTVPTTADAGGHLAYEIKMTLYPPAAKKAQSFGVATSRITKAEFLWFEKI